MKIKLTDGSDMETDTIRDYLAVQYEKMAQIIEWCRQNKIYIWAFTLDADQLGTHFYNLPDNDKERAIFLANMDAKLREGSKNRIRLVLNDEDGNVIL